MGKGAGQRSEQGFVRESGTISMAMYIKLDNERNGYVALPHRQYMLRSSCLEYCDKESRRSLRNA